MTIAVIGAGISGLTASLLLTQAGHTVTLFEQDPRLGGHAHTHTLTVDGTTIHADTGFLVYNEPNYPGLTRLFARLGVATTPTEMSFSFHDEATGFEYGGNSLAGLIGSPANLLRPRWWKIINGVARLKQLSLTAGFQTASLAPATTLADLRASGLISTTLFDDYLLPMTAAIWSAPREQALAVPARFMLRFFDNHGMLDLRRRPQWRTVVGGSRTYVQAIRDRLTGPVYTGRPVRSIRREKGGVIITTDAGEATFDHALLSCHSDQALSLLADPTDAERDVLGAIPYQPNTATLHSDTSLLPTRQRCWSAWNYREPKFQPPARVGQVSNLPALHLSITYNLSILQHHQTTKPLCLTLNPTPGSIDPSTIHWQGTYHHPVYSIGSELARSRWNEISGTHLNTHYAGAYWFNGFHEDGLQSALRVVAALGGPDL